jgi:acetolactate synthase-1/2/3 large subunit
LKTRTGAEIALDVLADEGVEVIFGYPGGAIMPLYDALYSHDVRHILVRHEAAAAFAASGYARTTGRTGVCMATSGPGATNLVTGIADALLDNVPLVAITGQVRSSMMGTDAFQEIDIVGITQAITKRSEVVRNVQDIEPALRAAFKSARGPRPGTALVDLPSDVLKARLERRAFTRDASTDYAGTSRNDTAAQQGDLRQAHAVSVKAAVEALRRATRPLIMVGGGARWSGATAAYRALLRLLGVPHCATLHGLGCSDPCDPLFLGMAGMHGTRRANLAIEQTDCLVALGMRFDDRITGDPQTFAPNARDIIHADIDASEFGKTVRVDIALHGDLRGTIEQLNARLRTTVMHVGSEWLRLTLAPSASLPIDASQDRYLSATDALDSFFAALPTDAIVTTDVGQHQMWAAQRVSPRDMTSFISSGGLGSMGFGLPAAIGAQIAHPNRPVFAVVGDGGFQMSMAELATLRRYNLPVKILLIDNAHLGMVRQWQELFFDCRYSETQLPENPDFTLLARAYDINSKRVDARSNLAEAMGRFIREPRAALLHCSCYPHENVWPIIPAGTSVGHMMDGSPA